MTESNSFLAEARVRPGTGGARECRRNGRVPAVIYGANKEPSLISLNGTELMLQLRRPGFHSYVYDIKVGDTVERALPREVQNDPLTGFAIHVDFLRLVAESKVDVEVTLSFINETLSPGLKTGGVLNIVEHSIELLCSPDNIPEKLEVDLTGLEIGDAIHATALKLPEGVSIAPSKKEATIATIASPTVSKAVAETDTETEEGEAEAE